MIWQNTQVYNYIQANTTNDIIIYKTFRLCYFDYYIILSMIIISDVNPLGNYFSNQNNSATKTRKVLILDYWTSVVV